MALVLKSNQEYSGNPLHTLNNNVLDEAVGIYSTQLISGQYDGALIRVVNSNKEEMDIFPNSKGVIDANQLITFSNGDILYVKTMYDQSGNGNDAKRENTEYLPVIVENGKVVNNSLGIPSVKYYDARGFAVRNLSKTKQSEMYRNKLSLYIDFEAEASILGETSRLPLTYILGSTSPVTQRAIAYRPLDSQIYFFTQPTKWIKTISLNPAKRQILLRNTYLSTQGLIVEDSSRNNTATVSVPDSTTPIPAVIPVIAIATTGQAFNDKASSFNGIINTVVVR